MRGLWSGRYEEEMFNYGMLLFARCCRGDIRLRLWDTVDELSLDGGNGGVRSSDSSSPRTSPSGNLGTQKRAVLHPLRPISASGSCDHLDVVTHPTKHFPSSGKGKWDHGRTAGMMEDLRFWLIFGR